MHAIGVGIAAMAFENSYVSDQPILLTPVSPEWFAARP